MPKLIRITPKYRCHKATRQAVVTLDGRDIYLGPWHSKASQIEYDRLIGEWMQNGRTLLNTSGNDLTVVELVNAYRKFANGYYVKNGRLTSEATCFREACRFVTRFYGRTHALDFGPVALRVVRQAMIDTGLSRGTVNRHIGRVRRMFKWAAAEQIIPASVPQALAMVSGLRKGRTTAREPEPVLPVEDCDVDATLPHLSVVVADMARFQRLTGCRPGEVCILRPRDVERAESELAKDGI